MKNSNTNLMAVVFSMIMIAIANADGNVEFENNNGNLRLRGANNTDQQIVISATNVPGGLMIESLDGTTFNGFQSVFVNGVFGDVRVDLGSGEKILVMTEDAQSSLRILGDLNINSKGNFPVHLFLDNLEVDGATSISTKNGDDIVFLIGGLYNGPVLVSTGNGSDVFGTEMDPFETDPSSSGMARFSDNLVMKMGKGSDYALIFNSEILGTADFQLGSGNDGVAISESVFAAVSINGGKGFDRAAEQDSVSMQTPVITSMEDISNDIDSIINDASNTTQIEAAVLFFFFP